jgi:hypothetical protein
MFSGAISVSLKKEGARSSEKLEKIFFFLYIIITIVVTNFGGFFLCVAVVAVLSIALLCACMNLDFNVMVSNTKLLVFFVQ